MIQVRIWDWPTRIFHWALAILIVALVITGNVGGNAMVWHFRCGYAVLSLLIFRFIWGFYGGHWSRWRQLACSPELIRQYFKSSLPQTPFLGHNPLGSLAVIAMLALLTLQVSTGLFSDDEISNAGPLVSLVSGSSVSLATSWHKGFGKTFILLLVAVHLLAMLKGDKTSATPAQSSKDGPANWLLAVLCILVSAGLVYALINLGATAV
jgi:cytochrome b